MVKRVSVSPCTSMVGGKRFTFGLEKNSYWADAWRRKAIVSGVTQPAARDSVLITQTSGSKPGQAGSGGWPLVQPLVPGLRTGCALPSAKNSSLHSYLLAPGGESV